METITILKLDYQKLKDCQLFLEALNAAGVDNWDGYSYAIQEFEENGGDIENI